MAIKLFIASNTGNFIVSLRHCQLLSELRSVAFVSLQQQQQQQQQQKFSPLSWFLI